MLPDKAGPLRPGSHAAEVFGLRNDYFEIAPHSQEEKTVRFPIQKGDIILGEWLYGKTKGFDYIVGAGGDFVMRLKHKAAKYYDEDGHRVELLPLLRELDAGEVLDVTLHYYSEPRKPASAKPLRICAIRKSPEQAERAKRKTRRKMRALHKKPLDPAAIEMSEYFVVGTSLPTDTFSSAQVLELYRLRWQLGQLTKTDSESCRAWLYGKMLYALLCYAIVDKGRSFSPWGYLLKIS